MDIDNGIANIGCECIVFGISKSIFLKTALSVEWRRTDSKSSSSQVYGRTVLEMREESKFHDHCFERRHTWTPDSASGDFKSAVSDKEVCFDC